MEEKLFRRRKAGIEAISGERDASSGQYSEAVGIVWNESEEVAEE